MTIRVVKIGDEVEFALDENPSTGHLWEFVNSEEIGAEVVDSRFEGVDQSADPERVVCGAGGKRIFKVKLTKAGIYRMRLELRRPWLTDSEPASVANLDICAEE